MSQQIKDLSHLNLPQKHTFPSWVSRVPAVPTPKGDDFSAVGQVGDECELGVTGPVVNQRLCAGGHAHMSVPGPQWSLRASFFFF